MGRPRIHKDHQAAVDWWRANNKKRARLYDAWHCYGITAEEYDTLFKKQDGCCAICLQQFDEDGKKDKVPHIDHDHTTGRIRGMLCGNCNRGLGSFKDSLKNLADAMAYLLKEG